MTGSRREAASRFVLGVLGIGLFLALWEVIGTYRLAGLTWPPLSTVLAFIADPGRWPLLSRAVSASITSVAIGYALGFVVGVAFALIGAVALALKPGLDRLIALTHAIPPVALAPIFMVLLSREAIPAALSALGVFYMVYVATSSGIASVSAAHRDLFRVLGSGGAVTAWRLYLPSALPALMSGLKLAVPIAFIGEIVGEWFGASKGWGLLMVSGMQNFQIPLLWSAVLIATATSLLFFALMSVAERIVVERFR